LPLRPDWDSLRSMSQRSELYLKTGSGTDSIYIQHWKPAGEVKATVLITHGVAEHSDCYNLTALALNQQNVDVWCWDLPGHGKSYGQRGYVTSFAEFTDRLLQVLHAAQESAVLQKPFILLGHSLGGLITIKFALDQPQAPVTAYALSSPALGVKIQVPFLKDQAARLLLHLAPKLTIPHQIIYEDLSRDKDLIKTYYKDPLRHNKFSAPLYFGILETMSDVHEHARDIKQPILIQAAGQDRIVDTLATQELFNKLGSAKKTMKIYPDSYHEIFNDTNKQEVIDDFMTFLREF
jgi:alpha-beta hydrolase superfamily lysophospholipase